MNLIFLITKYGYAILFPLAIIEGPIATIVAGFLVSLGLLNPFLVYAVIMLGDIIGDSLAYGLGRWGGGMFFSRIGPRIGVTPEKLEKVKRYFDAHGQRTITLSKIIHGIGLTGLVVAGMIRVPYRTYITICFLTTLVQAALFLGVGILFGHAYAQLNNYLNYFASVTVIIGVLVAFFVILIKKLHIHIGR